MPLLTTEGRIVTSLTSDALAHIKQGHAAWNQWRAQHRDDRIDLSDQTVVCHEPGEWDFSACELIGTTVDVQTHTIALNLSDTNATRIEFSGSGTIDPLTTNESTNLTQAQFDELTLRNSVLGTTKLTRSSFRSTKLYDITFGGRLEHVAYSDAYMSGCIFNTASLVACPFEQVVADRCEFNVLQVIDPPNKNAAPPTTFGESKFRHCQFQSAQFGGASLTGTWFSHCDLREIEGAVFDDTFLFDNATSLLMDDAWSDLVRTYTGPKMAFNLIFVILFFVPFVIEAAWYQSVAALEVHAVKGLNTLEAQVESWPSEFDDLKTEIHDWVQIQRVSPVVICKDAPEADGCWSLGEILVGAHRPDWFGLFPQWVIAGLLLVYNIGRGLLTFLVAPLRDEQVRTGHAPHRVLSWPSVPPRKDCKRLLKPYYFVQGVILNIRTHYRWMYLVHCVVWPLFFLSIVLAIFSLIERLGISVWVGSYLME